MRLLLGSIAAGLALGFTLALLLPGPLLIPASPDPRAPLPAASHTAAELTTALDLATAIRDAPPLDAASSGWLSSLRQSGGLPDVEVSGSTVTVFAIWANDEPTGPLAMALCAFIAPLAANARPSVPGGIHTVVVAGGAGGREELSRCDVPPAAS